MAADEPQHIILALLALSLLLGFLVRRFKDKTPNGVAVLLDLLPLAWMFFFTWALVHQVSDLIPARKHPPFANNALTTGALFAFVAALFPRNVRGRGVGVVGVLISLLAMCDILHMRIFGNVMPVGSHGSIAQLWDVRASIKSLFEKHDVWILAYLATALAVLLLWRVKRIDTKWLRIACYVVPVLALSFAVKRVHADVATFLDSKWAREVLNREDQVWNSGFLEAHVREISLSTKQWLQHKKPTTAQLAQVATFYEDEHAKYATDTRPSFGQFKGKNVIVLQIEAFEEWLVGATVNGQEITPYLTKLRDKSVYYPDIFNVVATSSTADCEYLFLNSNHPLPDGAVAFRREDNHFVTFATTLRDHGYDTLSMHGYRRGMWNRAVLHPRYGFTHSLFGEELGTTPTIGWGLDDHVFFDKLAAAAEAEKKPFFLYGITLSSHHPYNSIPWNRRRLHVGALEGTMVGEYMHSAAFVDDALSELFPKLEAAGLLNDTIVVMYGDHDGHLQSTPRDRANLASLTNVPKWKADYIGAGSWYRNRIPLLIMLPQEGTATVAHAFGSQLDFAPTILHYLGIEPPRSFTGHAILPGDTGGFVARWDGSFVAPPLIFDAGLDECEVLSDLRKLPSEDCRAVGENARREVDMSWLVTNNDLATWLEDGAKPLPPAPPASKVVTIGGACQQAKDCTAPTGYEARCERGICMTDVHGACSRPGSTAPCALGAACTTNEGDVNVCGANCNSFACSGVCNDDDVCVARP